MCLFWQDPKSLESVFSSLAIQILSLLLCFGSSLSEDEMMQLRKFKISYFFMKDRSFGCGLGAETVLVLGHLYISLGHRER